MNYKHSSHGETTEITKNEYFVEGETASIMGIIGNVLLTVAKITAGILGNSTAMIADGAHSASDIVSSVVVLLSLRIAKKPADEEHPYGHGKAESLATLAVGVFLLLAGLSIACSAIKAIIEGNVVKPGRLPLIMAIISIVSKELMYQYTYRIGKKIQSPSTIANALHHRSDAYSSIASLVGILGARYGISILDPIAGIGVTYFIIKMGWDVSLDGINQLMDGFDDEDMMEDIKEIIKDCESVLEIISLKARQSGPYIFIDLRIGVDKSVSFKKAHQVAADLRSEIQNKYDKVHDVLIHVDPIDPIKGKVANSNCR